jgi:DUF4097 and DUF4098 domain-containing protein YvlB
MNRITAFALVLFVAASVQAAEKNLDRTFGVSPDGLLVVDADSAAVEVTGAGNNEVTVHMSVRSSEGDLDSLKFDATQTAEGVTVTMRRPAEKGFFKWGSWNTDGRIRITVPKHYRLNIRTSGGNIEIADIVGVSVLHTSGGDISAKRLDGNVEARTSGGGIFADTIRGDVDAKTSGGDVHLISVDGKLSASTSGGSVECSLVGSNRGIVAKTSGGSIEITLPASTTGNVDATTSGGDVRSDLPVAAKQKQDDRLEGSLNGGGQPIELRTSGGSIALHQSR